MSCGVTRTRPGPLSARSQRTLPSSTYPAPSSRPISFSDFSVPLYWSALVRETTPRSERPASRLVISSVRPSAKYSSAGGPRFLNGSTRSEEHTSELQSRQYLVCRLLLEKKQPELVHTELHASMTSI